MWESGVVLPPRNPRTVASMSGLICSGASQVRLGSVVFRRRRRPRAGLNGMCSYSTALSRTCARRLSVSLMELWERDRPNLGRTARGHLTRWHGYHTEGACRRPDDSPRVAEGLGSPAMRRISLDGPQTRELRTGPPLGLTIR